MILRLFLYGVWFFSICFFQNKIGIAVLLGIATLALLVIEAAIIDHKTGLLPNRYIVPALIISIPLGIFLNGISSSFLGACAAALPLFIIGGGGKKIGMGDVKLCFILGWVIGYPSSLHLVLLSTVLMACVSLACRKKYIHGGPYIVLAGAIVLAIPVFPL